jgi:beta-lactamase regulating signal transducer with metallopeptidase domain
MLNETIHQALGWTLIHSIWQIGLACLLVYLLLNTRWLPKARQGFLITLVGIVSIGIMALLTFFIYVRKDATEAANLSALSPALEAVNPYRVDESSISSWLDNNLVYLSFAWISGFLVYGIRLIGGLSYLGLIRRRAVKVTDSSVLDLVEKLSTTKQKHVRIALYLSDKVLIPMTFGFYRVSIVFPLSYFNQMSLEETEIILAHEIAHILRYDYLINLLVSLVKTFFYFHPGIWWLVKTLDDEREKATDLLACQISHTDKLLYAKTLLKAQEIERSKPSSEEEYLGRTSLALPFWKSKKQLLSRVEHVLGKNKNRNQWLPRLMSFVLFISIFTLLSFTQIILPRSGKMTHPIMEFEEEARAEVIRVEAFTEKDLNDSLHIDIEIQIEKQNKEKDELNIQKERIRKEEKDKPGESEKIKHEVKVMVIPENQQFEDEEIYLIEQSRIRKPSTDGDPFFERNFRITEGRQNGENKAQAFWEQSLSLDSIQALFPFPIVERLNIYEAPKILLKETKTLDSLMRFEYQIFSEYSEHDMEIQKLYSDIPAWKDLLQENSFFERGDSMVFQYKLDKTHLENLKMEGLEHIEEFRFRHLPVDENRIRKIIYIENN